ncbi:hypothetical protein T492DRAFT_1037020 [Pavlovales sp. CCMP2436]|nr:hypothetical protein T492DRAFT_1037020 [Pavlovales sp. CCMP2436]
MMLLFATMLLLLSPRGNAAQGYQGYDDDAASCGHRSYDDDAASCGRRSVRARSVVMLSTRGTRWHLSTTRVARVLKWMCVARCGGRCCARQRAAHGDAAQGYQGYDDDAAPCGRYGRAAAAEERPRRGVGAGAHTLTPFDVSAGA